MKIVIGSDHRGYKTKIKLIKYLKQKGFQVEDIGTNHEETVDYTDFAFEVGERVAKKEFDFGVLICGTGMGMVIAANKVKGVRAVNPKDSKTALLCRHHNDANVLVFDEKMLMYKVKDIVDDFFLTEPLRIQRYIDRNRQVAEYEGTSYEL